MKAEIFKTILDRISRGETAELTTSAEGKRYVRRFVPSDRLIILGGGHIALSLSEMAYMLDFDIIVVDDRPSFANDARFPKASKVICDDFITAIKELDIRSTDYVCVVTRGHRWDKESVETIMSGTMPYYLGMIGSHRRVEGLKETLKENGLSPDVIEALHAPIGLKIGAVTTAEIAVSICAELIYHRRRDAEPSYEDTLTQTNTDIKMLRYLALSDEPRALLLVLSSTGSTPVKSGAVMSVNRLGNTYGTIGGGCSEAAAITRARRIIGTEERKIIEVDMSNDAAAENGMVCGGSMRILVEDIC